MRSLDILVIFRLDLGQVSFINLSEIAFETRQFAPRATSNAFYDILTRACAEIKTLRFFGILFPLSFFSFSFFCCCSD